MEAELQTKGVWVRGALLHDYFLYDWHQPHKEYGLHGFTHPSTALRNAVQDFDLNAVERNIIARHMFPLVPIPPRYRESVIVCLADKFCSLNETFSRAALFNAGATAFRRVNFPTMKRPKGRFFY